MLLRLIRKSYIQQTAITITYHTKKGMKQYTGYVVDVLPFEERLVMRVGKKIKRFLLHSIAEVKE
ncbi:YolD-like protein [Melghirimyces profundicolus]|uniref:YolD-like protein n=1 Tax=Melghirimyces profundicolus TaxID=1242148 RepID=A0A2T6BZ26_9BACL|nr:YolD-like family protein [Melghirimyces profundicolus]PTX61335.1 YolD-like protein [Melghirimyces profundicolus]